MAWVLDFYGQVGLALSAWKSENFQLAYSAYGASLPLASTTEQRSHILAAMATIAYKFQVRKLLFLHKELKIVQLHFFSLIFVHVIRRGCCF